MQLKSNISGGVKEDLENSQILNKRLDLCLTHQLLTGTVLGAQIKGDIFYRKKRELSSFKIRINKFAQITG